MSRIGIVIAYFFGSCVLGCLAAYPLHSIIETDFDKIVSRAILVSAVLLFYPTIKVLKITNWEYLGFTDIRWRNTLTSSWLFGIISLLPLTVYFMWCGYRGWEPLFNEGFLSPFTIILNAIISGLIVALIEETLFRGLLQSVFSFVLKPIIAIFLTCFLYSSVHFLEIPDGYVTEPAQWSSGFSVFFSSFTLLAQPSLIWDSWLALFAAGLFLSLTRLFTNNIFWCIGIHAGWVAHIKIIKAFTDRNTEASCGALVGTYDNYIGELSTAWIILLLISWILYRKVVKN